MGRLRCAIVCCLGAALWAQTAAPSSPLSATTDAKEATLPVVVRDGKGAPIPGLTKADFVLQVDGKPQAIRSFDHNADLPLTIGLLVDTSQNQRAAIDDKRTASQAFLDQMLAGAKDQAFVMQFARDVELLQDVTASKAKLQAALKELDTPPNDQVASVDTDDPDIRAEKRDRARGGTAFYDAVFLASDEVMRRRTGRKALILLTDGNDRRSKETLTKAIETAQRGDTVLYAIYFKGEAPRQERTLDDRDRYPGNGNGYPGGYPGGGYPGGGYPGGGYPGSYPGGGYPPGREPDRLPNARNDGKKILERMARETGGRMFEVSKKEPVGEIYAEIAKELRAQYRLAFTPEGDAAGDGYHKVELVWSGGDKKRWAVRTREGFYAVK